SSESPFIHWTSLADWPMVLQDQTRTAGLVKPNRTTCRLRTSDDSPGDTRSYICIRPRDRRRQRVPNLGQHESGPRGISSIIDGGDRNVLAARGAGEAVCREGDGRSLQRPEVHGNVFGTSRASRHSWLRWLGGLSRPFG